MNFPVTFWSAQSGGTTPVLPVEKVFVTSDESATFKTGATNGLIRLTATATKDTSYTTAAFNDEVNCVEAANNNTIYVGGSFTTYGGTAAVRAVRTFSDGSIDTSFNTSTGFNNAVEVIRLDTANRLYVGGEFTDYKGTTANRIIKLNTDGSKDTSFDNSTGFNDNVLAIAIDVAGKIYVGGQFTSYKGTTANYIIRLNPDGSKDTVFDNSTGFDNVVTSIVVDENGKIYVFGGFLNYKSTAARRIVRLNPDGSIDTAFDSTTGFNVGSSTSGSIAVDRNNKIVVVGGFTSYKSVTANGIIRLNNDGSKDTGLDNSTGFASSGSVIPSRIAITAENKIYVGGAFESYKGNTCLNIVKINADGSINTAFDLTASSFGEQGFSLGTSSTKLYYTF